MVRAEAAIVRATEVHGGVVAVGHLWGLDEDFATAPIVVHIVRNQDPLEAMAGAPFEHEDIVFFEDDLGVDAAVTGSADGDGCVVVEIRANVGWHGCPLMMAYLYVRMSAVRPMASRHTVETIIPMNERKPGVPPNSSPECALYPQIPRLTMNTAEKKAASLAKEISRFGSNGDVGIILFISDGSEDGDNSDCQEPHQANALNSNGKPYQTRSHLLMVPHNCCGAYSAKPEGYTEGDSKDGCEPGEADRFACAHGELLNADSWKLNSSTMLGARAKRPARQAH